MGRSLSRKDCWRLVYAPRLPDLRTKGTPSSGFAEPRLCSRTERGGWLGGRTETRCIERTGSTIIFLTRRAFSADPSSVARPTVRGRTPTRTSIRQTTDRTSSRHPRDGSNVEFLTRRRRHVHDMSDKAKVR